MKKISLSRPERSRSVQISSVALVAILLLVLLLSACGSPAAPTALPTVVLDGGSDNATKPVLNTSTGSVTASGTVVSAQEADLAFTVSGNIATIKVTVGDRVKQGQVLAELENASIQLDVENAQRVLRELTSSASIAAAEQAAANAQKEYDDAKKKLDYIKYRHTDNVTIDYLQDQVTLAQEALDHARDDYKKTSRLSRVDPTRASAATRLYNAQKAYNTAVGDLNYYANDPAAVDVAIAEANFNAAAASLQEAQWYLSELKGEAVPADATGARLTQLQQARDTLQAAQDQLEQTRLTAPFSGMIAAVNATAGEYASPGQVLVVLSDMDHLQVKTTDLSERDITQVKIGNTAKIAVDALGEQFDGKVVGISPLAKTLGGDVVYEVTIDFMEQPEGLLGGMSADVMIEDTAE